jgi:CheY-like chemotaxis protein
MTTKRSTSIIPKSVLIVEDSITEAETICTVLADTGLQVVWAVNGPDVLQKTQEIHQLGII